jgi:hypothetical protein
MSIIIVDIAQNIYLYLLQKFPKLLPLLYFEDATYELLRRSSKLLFFTKHTSQEVKSIDNISDPLILKILNFTS